MTLSDRSLISHFQKKKGMIKAAPNFSGTACFLWCQLS